MPDIGYEYRIKRKDNFLTKLEKDCDRRRLRKEPNTRSSNLISKDKVENQKESLRQQNLNSYNEIEKQGLHYKLEKQKVINKRMKELDNQIKEKRKLKNELKKISDLGTNDFLSYKDQKDRENTEILHQNIKKPELFDNSIVQKQIKLTEEFLECKKKTKQVEKKFDADVMKKNMSKEDLDHEYEALTKNYKQKILQNDLVRQMMEKSDIKKKEVIRDRSQSNNFGIGKKTPEKFSHVDRNNNILKSKFRNQNQKENVSNKENARKKTSVSPLNRPKPKTKVRAVPQKDIGKNLVAKDLFNELRQQMTGTVCGRNIRKIL